MTNSDAIALHDTYYPSSLTEQFGTFLLIHGAGMDGTIWTAAARHLSQHGMACRAIDLPGHGQSTGMAERSIAAYATILATWISSEIAKTQLLRQDLVLVGHSMGALIALELAALLKSKAIVLLGVASLMPVHSDLLRAAYQDLPAAAEMMTRWSFSRHFHTDAHHADIAAIDQMIRRSGPAVLANDLSACHDYTDAVDAVRSFTGKVHFVFGEEDRMTPPRNAESLVATAGARGTMATLPRCGHMMMIEDPTGAANLITQAIK